MIGRLKDKLRASALVDKALRYNLITYTRTRSLLDKLSKSNATDTAKIIDRLKHDILKAARQTRYGADKPTSLAQWPILEKTAIRQNAGDFMRSSLFSVAASTGGSSGIPLTLRRSVTSVAVEQAFIDALIKPFGLQMGSARVAVLRADEIKALEDNNPPYGVYRNGGRRLILSNAHLNKHSLDWFVTELSEFKPDLIWVYPSMLVNLIKLMQDAQLRLNIPLVLTSSEMISATEISLIERTLGCVLIDYYGQGERLCFAARDFDGQYWFQPAYGFVELLRTTPTSDTAEVIATGYWNKLMPLIRYRTGDLAKLPADATDDDLLKIAAGQAPFEGIVGRVNEYIVTADGGKVGGLNHLPRGVANLIQMQVIQHDYDRLTFKILTDTGFDESNQQALNSNIAQLIPPSIETEVKIVNELESLPNGKRPFVIRKLEAQS
ncbi:MAG: hypothetical protein AAF541_21260 [Pseudomonadota bacterium]